MKYATRSTEHKCKKMLHHDNYKLASCDKKKYPTLEYEGFLWDFSVHYFQLLYENN